MRIVLPGSPRQPTLQASSQGDASPALVSPPRASWAELIRTLPGRLLVLASGVLAALLAARALLDLPEPVGLVRRLVWLIWLGAAVWLLILAVSRNRRAFLWRVRQKLLLSYVFLGIVPVALVVAFVVAAGVLLHMVVASYVFQENYDDEVEDVRQIAETSAAELGRFSADAEAVLMRRVQDLSARYPALSLALVSAQGATVAPVYAGPWSHTPRPAARPGWLATGRPTSMTIAVPQPAPGSPLLVIRAVVPAMDGRRVLVADLPVDRRLVARLEDRTGTTLGNIVTAGCGLEGPAAGAEVPTSGWPLFRETVSVVACTSWADGTQGAVSIDLVAPVAALYNRLAAANVTPFSASLGDSWSFLSQLLILLGVLLLIIQGSALVMGAVLAKSITSAVHDLFEGTERVQQGDFAHRIPIASTDQLGELAGSFNRMSESIAHLLLVQREKQRLDDELRIAREIQTSLLPVRPPTIAGIDIADLCEPAREVGGDYYDFFDLGPRLLGVLIADVAGKGISAALYTAELKGLMLALSHTSASPRQLLIDVNRLLSAHLDNRSFITMTYVVLDLDRMTLTAVRAGHTPLLIVSNGHSHLVVPDGMVLGLRLPGADTRFESVLEEYARPILAGDVIVLYTDGITEATDVVGEMFGDAALARVVASQQAQSATGLRERVLREVRAFVGEAEPHDDMTMVVLKIGERVQNEP